MRPICIGFVAMAMTSETRWDRINKLGRTENVNLVTVSDFGGTDMQLGRTDSVRVWA